MRRTTILVALLSFVAADARARARPIRVAVLPMTAASRPAARAANKATRVLVKRLRRNRRYRVVVVPRARSRRLRECMQTPRCVKKVARRLRVRYLLAAHAERVGRRLHVDMRVISGRSGTVLSAGAFAGRRIARRSMATAGRLLAQARRGVKVARSETTRTDATFAPEVVTRSDSFEPEVVTRSAPAEQQVTLSEAELAAQVIEERDPEDPNADPEEQTKVALNGGVDSATPAAAHLEQPPAQEEGRSFFSRVWQGRYWHAWTAAGAGIAAIGAGAVFGTISKRANEDAHQADLQVDAWVQRDKARKNALVANVLFGAGGAAVLGSALLFYLENRQEKRELASDKLSVGLKVAKGGGAVLLKGRF